MTELEFEQYIWLNSIGNLEEYSLDSLATQIGQELDLDEVTDWQDFKNQITERYDGSEVIDKRKSSFGSAEEILRGMRDEIDDDILPYMHPAVVAEVAGDYGNEKTVAFVEEVSKEVELQSNYEDLNKYKVEIMKYLAFRTLSDTIEADSSLDA